jgi:aminoglycoside phosphotransferase (APT) family kinase protein
VVDWLRRRVPADAPPSLIHSDFKLDNMILAPETLAPLAVIDWDMGTRGDPLWDLAVMLSYWAEPEDPACLHPDATDADRAARVLAPQRSSRRLFASQLSRRR